MTFKLLVRLHFSACKMNNKRQIKNIFSGMLVMKGKQLNYLKNVLILLLIKYTILSQKNLNVRK